MVAGRLVALIKIYQRHVSPRLGERCRFYPSCSAYAQTCLESYDTPRALAKIAGRLLRCQPWHPGGVDLP